MTTQNCVDYFSILQDKYGSPNLEPDEIVDFLNHAQNEWLNRLVPDSQGGVVNFDEDSNTFSQVRPLVYTVTTVMTDEGYVSNLNALLATETGDSGAQYFRTVRAEMVTSGVTYPIKYVKQNNIASFRRNIFKTFTTTNPRYTVIARGLRFYPIDQTVSLVLTLMKKPRVLDLTGTEPEFDDYTMYAIIAIALQLAGVSTRDTEVIEDLRGITVQGK